jgi:hypothetical protein
MNYTIGTLSLYLEEKGARENQRCYSCTIGAVLIALEWSHFSPGGHISWRSIRLPRLGLAEFIVLSIAGSTEKIQPF